MGDKERAGALGRNRTLARNRVPNRARNRLPDRSRACTRNGLLFVQIEYEYEDDYEEEYEDDYENEYEGGACENSSWRG